MSRWFLFWISLLGFQLNVANSTICYQAKSYSERISHRDTRRCGWFGWSRCTYTYDTYSTRYILQSVCCNGYRGTNCDIPICNPPCSANGVCSAVNNCYCRPGSSGSTCDIQTCSSTTDCFPGTCNAANSCSCSSGFEGTSCLTIRDGGSFDHCRVTINDGQLSEYENDCVAPNNNIYTNIPILVDVKLEWQVSYVPPSDTPHLPPYILYSHPGIVETYARLQLKDESNTIIYNGNQACFGHNVSYVNPYLTVQCRNQFHDVTPNNAQHSYTLEVSFQSRTGGYKTVKNLITNAVTNRTYIGSQYHSEPIRIVFDTTKPEHCSQRHPPQCDYSDAPALAIFPDNRQDTEAAIQVFGWHDDDSFVKEYKFKMFQLAYDSHSGKLIQAGHSNIDVTWNPINEPPEITYGTGVYSIVMEIYDNAGNMAKARTLFIAEQENHVEHLQSGSVRVNGEEETPLGFWITDTGNINIHWGSLFTNQQHIDNHFYAAVQQEDTIDFDDLDSLEGNRTLSAIDHVLGITRFELGWRKLPENIITWEDIPTLTEQIDLNNLQRRNGDIFNFTLSGYDRTDFFKSHHFLVSVDSTPPTLEDVPFWESSIENDVPTDIYYASRLAVNLIDRESGIYRIHFSVHENQNGFTSSIFGSQIQHVNIQPATRQTECTRTGRCYCISAGGCFDKLQYIWINNCWFIGENGLSTPRRLSIDYSIINYAGITLQPASFMTGEVILSDLSGVEYYPVPENVGISRGRENILHVVWHNPPSCYPATRIVFSYIEGARERVTDLPGNATTHTLHDILPDTRFEIVFQVVYSDDISPRTEPLGFVAVFDNDEGNNSEGLSGGGIAGIVIAVLIFSLVLAALIIMIIRYRQHKHPVPVIIREVRDSVRHAVSKRFSRMPPPASAPHVDYRHGADSNVVLGVSYASEDDDMYIYGGMETDPNATWKHSEDRLVINGNFPGANGRFADIMFGVLTVPRGEKTEVVVKMNKAGASKEEKLLMTAKMNFLATSVPENTFVVRLIGAIPPPRGPMLLLEYCNSGTLLNWLKKITKVTGDIEEQMVIFTMQTAVGMAFLHDRGVLHRRLGARNVLLHKDAATSQLTAKLYGFGPLKGENEDNKKDDRIPIKFMAPEQLDKPRGTKRVYTKKTDVWTYGILLWEIFAKGAKPYSEKTIAEMKHFVQAGERMAKPSNCPHFLYNETITPAWDANPDMRPDFNCILTNLKREYGAQGGEDYANDNSTGGLYGNAMQVD